MSNNITFYIEILVRQEREALLVAAARKASRYFRSAICQQGGGGGPPQNPPNKTKTHAPPCRRFPEGPRTDLVVCIPCASAFQRPLTAHAEAR
jgi:hypothetical protein